MYSCIYQGLGLFTGKLPEALEPLAKFLDSKEAAQRGSKGPCKEVSFAVWDLRGGTVMIN